MGRNSELHVEGCYECLHIGPGVLLVVGVVVYRSIPPDLSPTRCHVGQGPSNHGGAIWEASRIEL